MRYRLTDTEADPAKLLREPDADEKHLVADVVGWKDGGAPAVIYDFVNTFEPRQLHTLRELTQKGIGYGVEYAGMTFDDDLDPNMAPFEGVLLKADYRDDEVVLSRFAFARLVDAMLDRAARRGLL